MCIASEVVYYSEFPGQATALAVVLSSVLHRCPAVELLLLIRVRQHEGGVDNSALSPSDCYDARCSVFDFIEHVLPREGLCSTQLSLGGHADGPQGCGLRLYRVDLAQASDRQGGPLCPATVPAIESAQVRWDLAHSLMSAWERQMARARC